MKQVNRLRMIALMVGLVAVFLLPACAKPAPAPTTPAPKPTTTPTATPTPQPTTPAAKPKMTDLRIGALSPGTSSYGWAVAIKSVVEPRQPDINVSVVPTPGAAQNAEMLRDSSLEMGIVMSYLTGKREPWWDDLRNLWPNMLSVGHIVVPENSPIKKFDDIKGKRIFVGGKGSASSVLAERFMDWYGWKTPADFTLLYGEQAQGPTMLREGTVDVFFMLTSGTTPLLMELSRFPWRYIQWPTGLEKFLAEKYEPKTTTLFTIKKGMYPEHIDKGAVNLPYTTVGAPVFIYLRKEIPEDVVYRLTKTFWDNRDEAVKAFAPVSDVIVPDWFQLDSVAPYHPGALKYYKEKGWVK